MSEQNCHVRKKWTIKEFKEYHSIIKLELFGVGINSNNLESWPYLMGAPFLLANEGKISPLHGDKEALLTKITGLSIEENLSEPEYYFDLEKKREDFLLFSISGAGSSYGVVWYGGGHNWLDNVEEWNSTYPDNLFSLIVITPEGYDYFE